nr:MAG: RNA-dependent RNA polymerase [Bunyavirales sp.]
MDSDNDKDNRPKFFWLELIKSYMIRDPIILNRVGDFLNFKIEVQKTNLYKTLIKLNLFPYLFWDRRDIVVGWGPQLDSQNHRNIKMEMQKLKPSRKGHYKPSPPNFYMTNEHGEIESVLDRNVCLKIPVNIGILLCSSNSIFVDVHTLDCDPSVFFETFIRKYIPTNYFSGFNIQALTDWMRNPFINMVRSIGREYGQRKNFDYFVNNSMSKMFTRFLREITRPNVREAIQVLIDCPQASIFKFSYDSESFSESNISEEDVIPFCEARKDDNNLIVASQKCLEFFHNKNISMPADNYLPLVMMCDVLGNFSHVPVCLVQLNVYQDLISRSDERIVQWSHNTRVAMAQLDDIADLISTVYKSNDLKDLLCKLKCTTDVGDSMFSLAEIQGRVCEIIMYKCNKKDYVDEDDKDDLRTILLKHGSKILKKSQKFLNGSGDEIIETLDDRMPRLRNLMSLSPDCYTIEASGHEDNLSTVTIMEFGWIKKKENRIAKMAIDTGRWCLLGELIPYLDINFKAYTMSTSELKLHLENAHKKNIDISIEQKLFDSFINLQSSISNSYRTFRLDEAQMEYYSIKHNEEVISPKIYPEIKKDFEKPLVEKFLDQEDESMPWGTVIPKGLHYYARTHIKNFQGNKELIPDAMLKDCIESVVDRKPSSLSMFEGTYDHKKVVKSFQKAFESINYELKDRGKFEIEQINDVKLVHSLDNRGDCDCNEKSEDTEAMMSYVSRIIRYSGPGGKVTQDFRVKLRDKISKILIGYMFGEERVHIVDKKGKLIRCPKTVVKSTEDDLRLTIYELYPDESKSRDDLIRLLRDKDYKEFEETDDCFLNDAGKMIQLYKSGVVPCNHNRLIFTEQQVKNINNATSELLLPYGQNSQIQKMKKKHNHTKKIPFGYYKELARDDVEQKTDLTYKKLSAELGVLLNISKKALKSVLMTTCESNDLKIIKGDYDWFFEVLLNNKFFLPTLIDFYIKERIKKCMIQGKGVVINSLTPSINVICNSVSCDNSQIIYMFQNRFTGEISSPVKMEKRVLTSHAMALPIIINKISIAFEQRSLFDKNIDPVDLAQSDESEKRYAEIVVELNNIKKNLFVGDYDTAQSLYDKIVVKKGMEIKKTINELLMYYCLVVNPEIKENSKNLFAIMQMSRYFYLSSLCCMADLHGLTKKIALIVRGHYAQDMNTILLMSYIKATKRICKNSQNPEFRPVSNYMFEGLTDYYSNLMPIENIHQCVNAVYYLHGSERMEMPDTSKMDAFNMLTEKAVGWKEEVIKAFHLLCPSCKIEMKADKFVNKEVRDFPNLLDCMVQKTYIDCKKCKVMLLHLECLFGFQICQRDSYGDIKNCLTEKMYMCSNNPQKITYYCFENVQSAIQNTYKNQKDHVAKKLLNNEKLFGEISEFMSTTNCYTNLPDELNARKALGIVKSKKSKKVVNQGIRMFKEIQKNIDRQAGSENTQMAKIFKEINDSLLKDLSEDTDFRKLCSQSLERNTMFKSDNRKVNMDMSFKDLCMSKQNELPSIMQGWYNELKNKKDINTNRNIGQILRNVRKEANKIIADAVTRNKIQSRSDQISFLHKNLIKADGSLRKYYDQYYEMISKNAFDRKPLNMNYILRADHKNEINPDVEKIADRLFSDSVTLREQKIDEPSITHKDSESMIMEDIITFRDKFQNELMGAFFNVMNRLMKYSVRWFIDRKMSQFVDMFVPDMENPYYVDDADKEMSTIEVFACCFFIFDYDLDSLFSPLGVVKEDVAQAVRSLQLTFETDKICSIMVKMMDAAIHSDSKHFNMIKSEKFEPLTSAKSEKVVIALAKLAQEKNVTSILELVKEAVEDPETLFRLMTAPKQQFGPIRDLGIQKLEFRILQYFSEMASKMLLTKEPHDMMTKVHLKDTFLNQAQDEFNRQLRNNKEGLLTVLGDNTSWGPKMSHFLFLTMSSLFQSEDFVWKSFRAICVKGSHKRVSVGSYTLERCLNMLINNDLNLISSLTSVGAPLQIVNKNNREVTYDELMEIYEIPEECAYLLVNVICNNKAYLPIFVHMIQGLGHMTSSLYHCILLNMLDHLGSESMFDVPFEITSICSSDDYGNTYKSDDFKDFGVFLAHVKRWERIRRVYSLSFNIYDSVKTLYSNTGLHEIYSQFTTSDTRVSPFIKQRCAMVTAPAGITPLDESILTWEMSKNCLENGDNLLGINIGVATRNLINRSVSNNAIINSHEFLNNGDTSHYAGFNPWVNYVKGVSFVDLVSDSSHIIMRLCKERIDNCKNKEEIDLDSAIIISSLFAQQDDDGNVKHKKGTTRGQNVIGNLVRFMPPIRHDTLKETLRTICPKIEETSKENLINKLIYTDKKAVSFSSASEKFRQALTSQKIIYNLVGYSIEQMRNMSTMARGAYYFRKPEGIDGPNIKIGENVLLSFQNMRMWKVDQRRLRLKIPETLEILNASLKQKYSLVDEVQLLTSCLGTTYRLPQETRLTKVNLVKNEASTMLQNDIYQIVAYQIDKAQSVKSGCKIDIRHLLNDVKKISLERPEILKLVEEIKGCPDLVPQDLISKLSNLCSDFRSSHTSKLSVYMQSDPTDRFRNKTNAEGLVRSKIVMGRIYDVMSPDKAKTMLEEENLKSRDYMTILNNISPSKFNVEKSVESLVKSVNLIGKISDDIFEIGKDPSRALEQKKLANVLKSVNKTEAYNRLNNTYITVSNKEGKTSEKLVISDNRSNTRYTKFMIFEYVNRDFKCFTNTESISEINTLVQSYITLNVHNHRRRGPKNINEFFSLLIGSDEIDCVRVYLSKVNSLRKDVNNTGHRYKGIGIIKIATENWKMVDTNYVPDHQVAFKQDKSRGLMIGHHIGYHSSVSSLDAVRMRLNSHDDEVAKALLEKMQASEFVEDFTIEDVKTVSLERVLFITEHLIPNVKRRGHVDISGTEIEVRNMLEEHDISMKFIASKFEEGGRQMLRLSEYQPMVYKPLSARYNLLKSMILTKTVDKENIDNCISFMKTMGIRSNEAFENKQSMLDNIFNVISHLEVSTKYTKSELSTILVTKYRSYEDRNNIKRRNKITLVGATDMLYSYSDNIWEFEFRSYQKDKRKRITECSNLMKKLNDNITLSDNNYHCHDATKGNDGQTRWKIRCPMEYVNLMEPCFSYIKARRQERSDFVLNLEVCKLILDLSSYDEKNFKLNVETDYRNDNDESLSFGSSDIESSIDDNYQEEDTANIDELAKLMSVQFFLMGLDVEDNFQMAQDNYAAGNFEDLMNQRITLIQSGSTTREDLKDKEIIFRNYVKSSRLNALGTDMDDETIDELITIVEEEESGLEYIEDRIDRATRVSDWVEDVEENVILDNDYDSLNIEWV